MNVASSFYHALHTSQLEAMQVIAPRPEFEQAAKRFARYARAAPERARAFARKVLFRLAVPRNELIGRPMRRLGARAARQRQLSDTLVLCYHAVSERWPAPLSVTPQAFERQLELLVRRGYEGATFRDAVLGGAVGKTWRSRSTTRTCRCSSARGRSWTGSAFPATVFVPTDWPGRGEPMRWPGIDQWMGGEFEPELRPLTGISSPSSHAHGWEIGSHTRSHPHLTTLDDAALDEELRESRAECERRLGRPCTTLAYPYGDYDARVAAAAGRAGYEAACTLPARIHPARPLEWPRVGVYHDDSERRYRLKVSPRRARGARLARVGRARAPAPLAPDAHAHDVGAPGALHVGPQAQHPRPALQAQAAEPASAALAPPPSCGRYR